MLILLKKLGKQVFTIAYICIKKPERILKKLQKWLTLDSRKGKGKEWE